jgi:hypothetical protein
VDLLLLVTEQEPVECDADEVAHDAERVQQVMPRLQPDGRLAPRQRVLSEVRRVICRLDTLYQRRCRQHQRPVREWNEETMPVHEHEVGNVAHEDEH